MAKWWPFGRKKKEEAAEEKPRGGLLGRLLGLGRKKEEEEKAPRPAPEAPPVPKEEAAPAPAPKPEAPPEEAGAPPEGAAPAAPPAAPPRTYPSFLHVDAEGNWVISETVWEGTMSGTLHGGDVKAFIDAMERDGGPDYDVAIPLIADAYGIPGGLVSVGRSSIYNVSY